ncbi:MAG: alpha-D-ribose 1-methylphosphonate 5-phosphate C-P-lyase PhnJ [Deltaproteobacteria bacterium]|jgi:alpha-D-ribose 1-methylphosphonate 5-phosphate C-P lyase|nr:alpha-D-ribose 1-methylphosphonate 5-phosphate C-P-lyase PhnJ [Deltaproteobacteria bacterium]
MKASGLNFAYLDEDTKRLVRRALLKAVAIPGYQVPFSGKEMPMPYGWGTGGIQVTASIIGPDDTLKVIDQGSMDTTNAVSIQKFFHKTAFVKITGKTNEASIIQTRHRIPETPLTEGQIMVYQVPIPEPLRFLEPRESEASALHANSEYGILYVKLYEDITRHGEIASSYDYPAIVNSRYAMSPSPIPRFDNPKLHMSKALHLFGAGREKRVYAVPPHTPVVSLDFEDYPFKRGISGRTCDICGSTDSFLDEVITGDQGERIFVCSDTDYCEERVKAQEKTGMNNQPLNEFSSKQKTMGGND